MKKSQTSNKVFTIQKMSDDALAELIKDLKADIEHLEFVYTAKNLSGMCAKEDIEPYARYRSYCILLLDAVKKERKERENRKERETKKRIEIINNFLYNNKNILMMGRFE